MSRLAVALVVSLGALAACGACSNSKASSDPPKGTPAPKPSQSTKGSAAEPAEPEGAGTDSASDSFTMKVDQPAPVAPGAEAIARVTITPGAGYHINQDFPVKLTLTPPADVKLAKTELVGDDAEKSDEHELVFAVKATPGAAGSFTLPGKIKFAVCKGEEDCEPKRRDVSFTIAAK